MRAYEGAKTEDLFKKEFGVPLWLFLEIEKRFKTREETVTLGNEEESQGKMN